MESEMTTFFAIWDSARWEEDLVVPQPLQLVDTLYSTLGDNRRYGDKSQRAKKACLKGFENLVVGKDCDKTSHPSESGIELEFLELEGERNNHTTGRGYTR
ncbi:hypothetical protein AVEN_35805-1 [Araneus ventricosus]|uniref:Uncharacterized protein n=1 Tax=Araneus ventricosus TaxID=182803 RepID=A0A4Y2BJM2_ARAVE|nr:hypothetical protein AVEN_35805-1 [Araneus ventricosus]